MNELILYSTDDGQVRLDLRSDGETIWLSQLEIAELFQTSKQNVSLHAKNIIEDKELQQDAVVKESLTTAADGKRYKTKLYNLDLILAIGYRVRSPRGVQFRQWASTHLKEFLRKGFVMDDERLKNPGAWDYFDELLADFHFSGVALLALLRSGTLPLDKALDLLEPCDDPINCRLRRLSQIKLFIFIGLE